METSWAAIEALSTVGSFVVALIALIRGERTKRTMDKLTSDPLIAAILSGRGIRIGGAGGGGGGGPGGGQGGRGGGSDGGEGGGGGTALRGGGGGGGSGGVRIE